MSKLILILSTSLLLSGFKMSDMQNVPIIIRSKKATFNKIYDTMSFEGKVKINFAQYIILTEKMITYRYNKNNQSILEKIDFPENVKLVKKDESEVIFLPNAKYNAKKKIIQSKGEIYLEKNDDLFKTNSILIELGDVENISLPSF